MITWRARRWALSDLATISQSSSAIESHKEFLNEVAGSMTISPIRSHLENTKDYYKTHNSKDFIQE